MFFLLQHAYHRSAARPLYHSNARLPSFCCTPITDLLHVYERCNARVLAIIPFCTTTSILKCTPITVLMDVLAF